MSELVEFRHLKYIVAVAETGNITRAAERLYVSQPSLSKQIRDIEEEIGVQIFDRYPDGVVATPVGQMIVDYAINALYGRTHILKMAKEVFLGNIPPLRLGFSSFVNPRHLQKFRMNYNRLFPNCVLNLSGGDTVHVLQRAERGEIDCAVLPLPIVGSTWHVQQIESCALVVCMRADDPLTEKSQVTVTELSERLTIFRDPEGHPSAHTRLVQMFSDVGKVFHISCSATTPHDIQHLVRDGYGLALVSEDTLLESDVTTRHIAGVRWTADIAFVHHRAAEHPALSLITRYLLNGSSPVSMPRKRPRADPPQLPLRFSLK